MQRLIPFVIIIIILSLAGCSKSGDSPVLPVDIPARDNTSGTGHLLWGLYRFTADPQAGTLDILPLRQAGMHLNALPFLEPPALVNLSLESLQFNGNLIEADIGLRHPFLGLTEFTGFDVCGIVISKGNISGFTDGGIVIPGAGNLRLVNADGHSRWWNPVEFPHNTGMTGYKDGLLGTPDSAGHFTATVNGYKYFCDDITDPDATLSSVTPDGRGVFNAGQKCIRHYTIDISSGLVFNYAVDASWVFPTGAPPWKVPDSFPPAANRCEPWWIDATIVNNYLWNDGTGSGGYLELSFDVYDWYNIQMNTVRVESPGCFTPILGIPPTGGGEHYSTYEVEITDPTPGPDEIQVLITVASEEKNFQGFIPGTNTSAYLILNIPVGPEQVEPPVAYGTATIEPYFDGFGPIGTTDEPVPTGWPVHLDASGSSGPAVVFLWEMNGDDLFDDAVGKVVTASFPDSGTHVIKLKVTNGGSGADIYELPGSYVVVDGTYVWAAFSGTSDGSPAKPWKNIPNALTDAGADGFILVRGDNGAGGQCTYSDNLTLNSTYQGTRIQGYYGDVTTDEPPMQTGYVRTEANDITFDGFEVTGPAAVAYWPSSTSHQGKLGNIGGENVLFRHLYIHDINHTTDLCKAILCFGSGTLVAQNILEVDLRCSYLCNQVLKILTEPGNPSLIFTNCTMDRLGFDTGIAASSYYISGGNGEVYNSIWTDCMGSGGAYFRRGNLSYTTSNTDYTDTFDTPIPPDGGIYYSLVTKGPNCIEINPQYADYLTNHHLLPTSPCINKGNPDPAYNDPDGSLNDMGCYGGPWGDWDFEN